MTDLNTDADTATDARSSTLPARRPTGPRAVLLAVAGVLLAVGVMVLLLALLRPGPASPGEVIKSARLAANVGDYSKANSYLSPTAVASAQAQGVELQAVWDQVTHDGQLQRIDILQTTTRGEVAIVRYRVTYRDGTTESSTTRVVKEHGVWKEGFDIG